MLSAEGLTLNGFCNCITGPTFDIEQVNDLIRIHNHLIFDFDTHQFTVERLPDENLYCSDTNSFSPAIYSCILQRRSPQENPISYYLVNIEKLTK
jgi:hypothetical protein